MLDKLRSFSLKGRFGHEREAAAAVLPPSTPFPLPPTPPPTPVAEPTISFQTKLKPSSSKRVTCCSRLASLFHPESFHLGFPRALFLNLAWRERRNLSKTCRMYYLLWYKLDLVPRILHDGAFGAEVGGSVEGMSFQCVVDLHGRPLGPHGFTFVREHVEEPTVSCELRVHPPNIILRFRPGHMSVSVRCKLKPNQRLHFKPAQHDYNYATPSGCFLFYAQWVPARHPPEQDGIIEAWSTKPFASNGFTVRDLVQIATLLSSHATPPHPVTGFTPLSGTTQWASLQSRPPLPDLPPGIRKLRFRTEHAALPFAALDEFSKECGFAENRNRSRAMELMTVFAAVLESAEDDSRQCHGVCCPGPSGHTL